MGDGAPQALFAALLRLEWYIRHKRARQAIDWRAGWHVRPTALIDNSIQPVTFFFV